MILSTVKSTIKKFDLLKINDKILIGVSGGADSTTLLLILAALKKDLNLSLHIAHLDHMLRKDSYKDAGFVAKLAGNLGIPLTVKKLDIKKLNNKASLEETARNARLEFFFETAKTIQANKIALGHNFDDQSETVLMRILRGTGLYGLAGILPKRELKGFKIIRPLIEVKRKEIEAYLSRKKIIPRTDKSNFQDIYYRNKLRNKLLPLLQKEYNRNIKEVLNNLAESAGYDYDFLEGLAKKEAKDCAKLNLTKLSRMHPSLRRLTLRSAIARLKGDTRTINFQHLREIEDLIINRPTGSIVDLPKQISVIKNAKFLNFYIRKSK